MANYGTDRVVLQDTTGAIQNEAGAPILSTESSGGGAFVFGAITQGLVARGIENGDWATTPSATGTASPITIDNDLPYWDLNGTAVSFAAVEDASSASGYIIRATVPAGTGISSTLSRTISIPGSRNRGYSFAPSVYTFNAVGTPSALTGSYVKITATWLKADGTTTTGVATSGSATFSTKSVQPTLGTATTIPSDCAFALIEITVGASAIGKAAISTIDLGEVSLIRGETTVMFTPANATGSPGTITGTNGGGLTMGSGVQVVGNLSMESGTAGGAAGNLVFNNAGTLGTVLMYSTGLLDYANLYANDAGLRTDQRFVVGSRTSPSVNQVDAPGVIVDAGGGYVWADRSPNSAATDASLFLSSGYFNGNLQMVRFFRKITVGGTALSATGHILVANNTTTAPSFGAGSDWRLKSDVRDASDEINFVEKINDLRPVLYTETGSGDEDLLGFIAHEVQAVIPNAVEGAKDALDENGDPVFQMLYPAKFIPYLVGAVRELTARVEELEAKVAHLESVE